MNGTVVLLIALATAVPIVVAGVVAEVWRAARYRRRLASWQEEIARRTDDIHRVYQAQGAQESTEEVADV